MKIDKSIDSARDRDVSSADVKAIKEFSDLNDEQAEEIASFIKVNCEMLYSAYQNKNAKHKKQPDEYNDSNGSREAA